MTIEQYCLVLIVLLALLLNDVIIGRLILQRQMSAIVSGYSIRARSLSTGRRKQNRFATVVEDFRTFSKFFGFLLSTTRTRQKLERTKSFTAAV